MRALKLKTAAFLLPPIYGFITLGMIGTLCSFTEFSCSVGPSYSFVEASLLMFVGATVIGAVLLLALGLPLFLVVRRLPRFRVPLLLIASPILGLSPLVLPCIFGTECPSSWPMYAVGAVGALAVGMIFCWIWNRSIQEPVRTGD